VIREILDILRFNLIIEEERGINMQKIPVSILIWKKYEYKTLQIKYSLIKKNGFENVTEEYIGGPSLHGNLWEDQFDKIEKKYPEIVGIFKDSEYPKTTAKEMERLSLPLLPGDLFITKSKKQLES